MALPRRYASHRRLTAHRNSPSSAALPFAWAGWQHAPTLCFGASFFGLLSTPSVCSTLVEGSGDNRPFGVALGPAVSTAAQPTQAVPILIGTDPSGTGDATSGWLFEEAAAKPSDDEFARTFHGVVLPRLPLTLTARTDRTSSLLPFVGSGSGRPAVHCRLSVRPHLEHLHASPSLRSGCRRSTSTERPPVSIS